MKMTTEQEEAETAKAAETDTAAMEKLLSETLDAKPPDEPPPQEAHDEPPAAAAPPAPVEPPPSAPPPAGAPPASEPDEFEKELESPKYELPAGATRQAREINKAVKHTAREQYSLRKAAETASAQFQKENEELKKSAAAAAQEHEELERLRPIVETIAIERDPRLNERFGTEMARIDNRLITSLMKFGLTKETADYIMQHGGPARFSRDTVSQVEAEPEHAGGNPVQMSHKQFWDERVVKQLSEDNKRSIKLAFDDELRLKEWHDAELRSKLSNREQYFKDLEQESKANQEKFQAACKTELDGQLKELGDLVKERTIPTNATPEQRQRIESYNTMIREAASKFDATFFDTSPKALVRKNLGGLFLDNMKTLIAIKDAEIAEEKAAREAIEKKWNASLKAANTSSRQSVQQQAKPLEGAHFDKNDGARMEKMMMDLPA